MEESRDAAAVRVFPPGIPVLTILLGVGLNRLWPLEWGFEFPTPANYWIGGAIVVSAILGLGWRSVTLLHRTGQSENPWKPTTEIVTSGPFRFTRNPMYLQLVLVCIGFAIILTNIWILLLTPGCAWVLTGSRSCRKRRTLSASLARSTFHTNAGYVVGFRVGVS